MLEQNHRDDELTEIAISNAKKLITSAKKSRRIRDEANRKRIARLFKDPVALEATITLTDEVMRISSPRAATRILRRAAAKASIRGFGLINSLGLRFIALLSGVLPRLILRIVYWRVRS